MLETLDYTIHIGSTPHHFIIRFLSLLCRRSTLRLWFYLYMYIWMWYIYYIYIYIYINKLTFLNSTGQHIDLKLLLRSTFLDIHGPRSKEGRFSYFEAKHLANLMFRWIMNSLAWHVAKMWAKNIRYWKNIRYTSFLLLVICMPMSRNDSIFTFVRLAFIPNNTRVTACVVIEKTK